ncbi:MAG: prephenate dehydratase [Candidatus Lokiarchaeota archaeon]|nr:prephenate dehydratase [Candidatus Lokiarchaeota archaeon]
MLSEEINDLRKKIDNIDRKISELIDQRMHIVKNIGDIKKSSNIPTVDYIREKKIYDKLKSLPLNNISGTNLINIYREIIAAGRSIQEPKKTIAFLGPEGTFSEYATKKFFTKSDNEFHPCKNISSIFRNVQNNNAHYGVIPVENSMEGSISRSLDLLIETPLKVCGEIIERITHNLISQFNYDLNDIQYVISHPQPLGQCKSFIEENLSNAKILEVSSTAVAVKMLSQVPYSVAIGTNTAADLYNMQILQKGIEDNPNNYTRFLIIGNKTIETNKPKKTSIIFSVKHEPGALVDALKVFQEKNINLLKLESRPSRKDPWEYYFFTDFRGNTDDPTTQEALKQLKNRTLFLKILGSYCFY